MEGGQREITAPTPTAGPKIFDLDTMLFSTISSGKPAAEPTTENKDVVQAPEEGAAVRKLSTALSGLPMH